MYQASTASPSNDAEDSADRERRRLREHLGSEQDEPAADTLLLRQGLPVPGVADLHAEHLHPDGAALRGPHEGEVRGADGQADDDGTARNPTKFRPVIPLITAEDDHVDDPPG